MLIRYKTLKIDFEKSICILGLCIFKESENSDKKWFFNGRELKEDGQLLINSLNIHNEGNYECIASNKYGIDRKSIMISLAEKVNQHKPTISIQVLSNPVKDHVANGQVKLKCISGKFFFFKQHIHRCKNKPILIYPSF